MRRRTALWAVVCLGCWGGWLGAQTLDIRSHTSIAPLSIAIDPTTGATGIGMVRLGVKPQNSGETTSISEITLAMTSDGAFSSAAISDIHVYFENGGNAEYDNGAGVDDAEADTGGVHTFTGSTATIPLSPALVQFPFAGGDKYLYVVFDFTNAADTTTNVGCEITSVTYGAAGVGTGSTLLPIDDPQLAAHGQKRDADTLEATMDASWIGPAAAAANASKVGVLRLDFDALDSTVNATTAPVQLDKVRVHRTFGLDSWVGTAGVLLYADVDGDGAFEPDLDDGSFVASANLSGGYALLDPANIPITSAGRTYFVAVNMNGATAQVGQAFGVNIDNPSTDIIFSDEIDDDAIGDAADPEYAYLIYTAGGTWEYAQKGYVTSTTADPTAVAGNTFTINPADDGNPPQVATTVPSNSQTNVDRNADLTVVFNEYMDEASVENPANFTLSGAITPTAFTYTAATQTLVVTLPTLAWGTTYTATVESTVVDYYGMAMGADYSWSFTVEPAVYPTVLAVSPAEGAGDVAVEAATTTVRATFSEPLKVSTVGAGDLTLEGLGAPISGTVSYDAGTQSIVFTADADLEYDTLYTATVVAGAVTDEDDLPLQDEKTWSFRTIRLYPPFDEPIAIKNRIVTGGNQQVLIFVTEPPKGPADKVSVQVFTTSGRRVATLINNRPFSSIVSPIIWEGRNDKGKDLGPGMYLVQIRATDYKRVLRVMIVR